MCSATEVRSGRTELGLLNLEKERLAEGTEHFTEAYESLIRGVKNMKLDFFSVLFSRHKQKHGAFHATYEKHFSP